QAEDGIRDLIVTGVQTCALPISLRDLGEHRLKDLALAERIHQLVIEGLPNDFPPLRSLDRIPNNLPEQVTTFIGRDGDILQGLRSEERRVGKECRWRWGRYGGER